jgi:hypothetical protein
MSKLFMNPTPSQDQRREALADMRTRHPFKRWPDRLEDCDADRHRADMISINAWIMSKKRAKAQFANLPHMPAGVIDGKSAAAGEYREAA